MYKHWRPSKAQSRAFSETMREIESFCIQHGITKSRDSYYFTVDGQRYRVSNHTVEASNRAATNCFGVQTRDIYHPDGRRNDTVYIHAGKTRIREIYNDLVAGYALDGRGNRK